MSGLLSRRIEIAPRRWMFLPIGVKVRELDGSACLAFEAAERGWGVILGGKDRLRDRNGLPRGMQIEKKIANGVAAKIPKVRAAGRKVSAWCEEGLVYPNWEEYGWRKIEREAYDLLDVFFAWGENQAEDMAKLGCNGEKLVITGNPRFDLHRADFRAVFDEKVARIKNKYAPFILVNTKFSLHNWRQDAGANVAKMRQQNRLETLADQERVAGAMAFHAAGFATFMEAVGVLSRRFPDHTIVVRPHPAERFDPWAEKAASLPNVEAIREGNVVEWILASEVSIHNNCTTGVESYLLGKPAISYRPVRDPRFDLFLPNALSVNAFEIDQLTGLVEAALRGDPIASGDDAAAKAELARRYIANVTGKRASQRIMDVLDAMDLPEEPLSIRGGALAHLRIAAGKGLQRLKSSVRGGAQAPLAGATAAGAGKRAIRRDNVSKLELVELLSASQRATGRYSNVQVSEIEDEVLCIH